MHLAQLVINYALISQVFQLHLQIGQSIQEWPWRNLWKTAFKNFEVIICLSSVYLYTVVLRCSEK